MTWFADLSHAPYFAADPDRRQRMVGWLEPGHRYRRGAVESSFVAPLTELLHEPWEPAVAAGHHDCGFCRLTGGPRAFEYAGTSASVGASNVLVPGHGVIYVAPSLILHYIDAHGYAPPRAFRDAVLACPPMRSMPYFRALKENGPPGLIGRQG